MRHFNLDARQFLMFLRKTFSPPINSLIPAASPVKGNAKSLRMLAVSSGLLVLGVFAAGGAIAQTPPLANLSGDGILQLPANLPLSDSYYFDLSQYQFGSDDEMTDFLSNKSGDNYIVRALPHLQRGILMLSRENHPAWTVADWNVYLNTASTLNPILPGAPNSSSNN